ncbi:MAG: DNA-protecting protein DprA [Planctomycetes bacterium]|jgi:DNA processing protein|nr:DNA-protecting protein DprA [Planctomycetota bacterium]MDP6409357.1 DNA-processing protein DprA [Planctomycetota bacterium]
MAERERALMIEPGGPSWPASLEHIDGPPGALWLRGRAELLTRERRIALVGTRSPTPYGEAQALRFGAALAEAGVTVVSGMARGVDQAAHRGALKVEGDTVAVLGSGVDRPWPRGPLVGELAERGLLVSEFPPGQSPRPHHFPLRNRIISGLADAVLVIEAAAASGSLITAQWALDQGRGVLALPGRVDHPMSRGTHRLLREGAQLVESPEELISEVYGEPRRAPAKPRKPESPCAAALRGETMTADELAARLGREVEQVLVELVGLELAGDLVRCPGGLWRRAERGL